MTPADFQAISAPLVLGLSAVVILLLGVFSRDRAKEQYLGLLALLGIACSAALLLLQLLRGGDAAVFGGLLSRDAFGASFGLVLLAGVFLSVLMSLDYSGARQIPASEYYSLSLFAASGMCLMAMASELVILFVSLEITSLSVYALVGSRQKEALAVESSLKYFILGAFGSALLLYGIAYTYVVTGSTSLNEIDAWIKSSGGFSEAHAGLIALGLIITGFGFKIAAVPFHMWTPDVYEGAPTSVTALMASAVKAAGFAALARVLLSAFGASEVRFGPAGYLSAVAILSVLTMSVANFIALTQRNIKRMLAYSSIAHTGYALIGLAAAAAGESGALRGVIFYMAAYTVMTVGAFAVLGLLEGGLGSGSKPKLELTDYAGLARRNPLAALAMAIFMFSLAGMPPLAGFFAKFHVLVDAVRSNLVLLALIGLLNCLLGAYYYLRVVVAMYMEPGAAPEQASSVSVYAPYITAAIIICVVLTILLGLLPTDYLAPAAAIAGMVLSGTPGP